MNDFVTPEPVRLPLSGGKYIDVWKRLTHGQSEDLFAIIYPQGLTNRREVRTAKIVAYLLAWNLTKDGTPVPYSLELPEQTRTDTVRALDPDRAVEMYDAITAHEDAMAAARAAQKKILAGLPPDDGTSSSPSAGAGPSEKSAPST